MFYFHPLRKEEKHYLVTITGSVDGEKNVNNNVNHRLINIYFNNEIAI